MRAFLIEFKYQSYCQGWESAYTTVLVYADSYEEAVDKLKDDFNYDSPEFFTNKTIT
jgi:hypothetical protein